MVVTTSIDVVEAAQWNACAGGDALLQHAFFRAFERSGAVGATQPIRPLSVLLRDPQGGLLACAPAMLRVGTLAEYGPEERWLKTGLAEVLRLAEVPGWPAAVCGTRAQAADSSG